MCSSGNTTLLEPDTTCIYIYNIHTHWGITLINEEQLGLRIVGLERKRRVLSLCVNENENRNMNICEKDKRRRTGDLDLGQVCGSLV